MDNRHLEYFVAIARHGGVRHAADELNVSPGNLSEQIKSLENELGVRLFDRGPRSLKLTQPGAAFLERAEQALLVLRTAREEMLDFVHLERGQLLVGALPGLGPFWLSRFLVAFLNRHPHVDLRLIERGSSMLLKLLASGEVHAACVLLSGEGDALPPGLSAHRLIVAPLAVVVSPQHPLARQSSVCLEQLADERLILTSPEETPRLIVGEAFRARGLEPKVCFEANDPITLVQLAAGGVGVGITGASIGRHHADKVVTIPFEGASLMYSVCVAWAAERGPHTRALDTFLRFVLAWWRDNMNQLGQAVSGEIERNRKMKRSTSRILTTHAGSLPRPAELDDALERRAQDEHTYASGLERAVADVVKKQVEAGVDVVNDGEFGKSSWTGYLTERLGGFEARPVPPDAQVLRGKDRQDFAEYYLQAARAGTLWYMPDGRLRTPAAPVQRVCTGPITYTGQPALQRDIDNFKSALNQTQTTEAFLPVAAPASVEPGRVNEHYASEEEFVFALAEALKVEYDTIVSAGLLVQVDDAFIPYNYDRLLADGKSMPDYLKHCELRIEALNHALRDVPEERVRYHICWGSWHGPHSTDVPLRDIVHLMLRVKAQAYLFEAANVRHEHEYHIWEDVKLPEGKILIPGVVSHATNVLEHPEFVAERIERFVQRVGQENVMGGTDCGLGGRVHPQLAWAKLQVLAEGAALASQARSVAAV
jgi:5-methyltetrahydropteroyltriglutamate--homocysteine methyltransferase